MPRALVILTHLLQELDFEEWFKLNAEWVKSQSSEAGLVWSWVALTVFPRQF